MINMRAVRKVSRTFVPPERRPYTPPERSVLLLANGTLQIRVGEQTDRYRIEEMPTDFGRGFQMQKIRTATVYNVYLDPKGWTSCDCKGGCYSEKCKHQGAVSKLVALGKL